MRRRVDPLRGAVLFLLAVLILVSVVLLLLPPAATPAPPAAFPSAASTPGFVAGGLGWSRARWEQQHGAPNRDGGAAEANYENDKYIVGFAGNAEHTTATIERQAGNGHTLDLATTEAEARAMLPADARLVETHLETPIAGTVADPADVVEQYRSPTLTARYPTDFPWWDGGPGSIGIIYYGNGDGWILAAGYAK